MSLTIAEHIGKFITVKLIAHNSYEDTSELLRDFDPILAKQLTSDLVSGKQVAFDLECAVILNATEQTIGRDWLGNCIYPKMVIMLQA